LPIRARQNNFLESRFPEEWYAFGPPAFQTEMHERIGRGEQPWA
jgi:hypothetical protein